MSLTFGLFGTDYLIIELSRESAFIRLPFIGQGHLGGGFREWDWWGKLRVTREVGV